MDEATLYASFGRLVRQHRERLDMSQSQLAKHVRLSRASVANIESGRQRIPLHQLFRLGRALKVDAGALLPDPNQQPAVAVDREITSSMRLSDREQADIAKIVSSLGTNTARGSK